MTTCSIGAFLGIGIYRNDEKFYDNCLMPIVQLCPPELCHRLALLGFKYGLFPAQKQSDSDLLVNKLIKHIKFFHSYGLYIMNFPIENEILQLYIGKPTWNRSWF